MLADRLRPLSLEMDVVRRASLPLSEAWNLPLPAGLWPLDPASPREGDRECCRKGTGESDRMYARERARPAFWRAVRGERGEEGMDGP